MQCGVVSSDVGQPSLDAVLVCCGLLQSPTGCGVSVLYCAAVSTWRDVSVLWCAAAPTGGGASVLLLQSPLNLVLVYCGVLQAPTGCGASVLH